MDPALSNFVSNLKRQAANMKIGSFEMVGKGNSVILVDVVPASALVPLAVSRKMGRPPKAQAGVELRSSFVRQSSMLNPSLQVAQALKFDLRPEDESVLAVVPTANLIEELLELQSLAVVVGKTLGEKLKRTSMVLVLKLKTELAKSANSFKATVATAKECKEKMRQDQMAAEEVQEALKSEHARVEAERNQLLKEKVDAKEKEKTLVAEMEKCHSFMLRINEEIFWQGVRQVAFYNGVSANEPRYDLNKDVLYEKLVPLVRVKLIALSRPSQSRRFEDKT